MGIIHAIILGIIQGLTEFLPISSNAHLRIVPALLHWNYSQQTLTAFTAVIQLGTVLAVLIYFAKDLRQDLGGWIASFSDKSKRDSVEAKIGWGVFWGTIPIIILGVVLHKQIETTFRSLNIIGAALIGMGIIMLVTEMVGRKERELQTVTVRDGIIVGLWQVLALIPGMSRSGSTISGAFSQGFNRSAAAKYSFLLSIPSVTAAGIYEAVKARHDLEGILGPVLVATVVAFFVGYASIAFLMNFLKRRGIAPFVLYRVVLGVVLIGLVQAKILDANAGADTPEISKVHAAR